MVTIINQNTLPIFLQRFDVEDSIVIPIFVDGEKHPANTQLCFLYVVLGSESHFVLPFHHHECINLKYTDVPLSAQSNQFVWNKKFLDFYLPFVNAKDINGLQYIDTTQSLPYTIPDTLVSRTIKRRCPDDANGVIPINKHIEVIQPTIPSLLEVLNTYGNNVNESSFQFFNDRLLSVFRKIEQNGLFVDVDSLKEHFDKKIDKNLSTDGYVYSEYNPYTSAGRPSNRFGGINFNALEKETGKRESFISRFGDNGMLIQFDYDAYHPRLIAKIIGYQFPQGQNVHEYLGKYYFDKDSLTEEEYKKSKELTFTMLYGGISEEHKSVPYYKAVGVFIDSLWEQYWKRGYIQSLVGERKLFRKNMPGMSKQKLFNYFIQLHETEMNVLRLEELQSMTESLHSKLILYTYDAFMFDFDAHDGFEALKIIKDALECEGTYPTKVYCGQNYHVMANITNRF